MDRKLSERQKGMLDFIAEYMDDHNRPPTVRDIQAGCEISSTSVVDYNLHILEREGYLSREPTVSRGIELLDGVSRGSGREIARVPIIGSIAAGEPLHIPSQDIPHDDDFESVDVPAFLTRGRQNVFGLRVKGNSMIDALVADGDLVLMEPAPQPETGDMVAAWLTDRDETTLKRFYVEGDQVRLEPANETMEPITVPAANVAVRGRVVGVFRQL